MARTQSSGRSAGGGKRAGLLAKAKKMTNITPAKSKGANFFTEFVLSTFCLHMIAYSLRVCMSKRA
jgi:hypothetical protein